MARDSIVDRLLANGEEQSDRPAMWHKVGNTWKHITWEQYCDRARNFAGALLEMGFERGDGVSIMSYNNPEWVIADTGTMMAGGVPAGIYQTCTPEQTLYIANHCEAKVLVLEDIGIWEHLGMPEIRDQFEHTEKFLMIRDADQIDHPDVMSFDEFLEMGAGNQDAVDARLDEIEMTDLATLIYTSGTTGPPKGVMLSHENLAWTSQASVDSMAAIGGDDCIVSYLPLSHIAEQMFSIHLPITAGFPIWFAEDLTKLKDCLVVARPTIFLAVPRVWEKFRNALELKLGEATGVKKGIVDWSRKTLVAAGHIVIEQGEEGLPFGLKVQYDVANKLFSSKLKAGLGLDRLKVAVTGAAPISYEVLEFFLSCGIIIHEVYGQSEGTGPSTFNQPLPGKRKLGCAGLPFPGDEVKIAEDGEILMKGPNVFLGYFKNPEATAETLKDGWLYSGDVGEFDKDGFLRITDRKKDLIITAGGKNVAPQNIEKLLKEIEGVSQAVVIGDQRKFLSALLTVCPETAPDFAESKGWPMDTDALAEHDEFRSHVEKEIERRVNQELARYETIKKFALLPNDFTVETGELTPTQKVKRKVVNEKYTDVIEGFYAGLD